MIMNCKLRIRWLELRLHDLCESRIGKIWLVVGEVGIVFLSSDIGMALVASARRQAASI